MRPKSAEVDVLPVFLRLAGKPCLVVGGGAVGLRKVRALLHEGAVVTLVSPTAVPELRKLAEEGSILWLQRPFVPQDAQNMSLVFVATDDRTTNAVVAKVAKDAGVWVNAADDPENCDFYMGSVLRSGPVVVGISTSGSSPALARHLRDRLQEQLNPGLALVAEILAAYRPRVNRAIDDESRRASFWRRAVEKLFPMGLAGSERRELERELHEMLLREQQEGTP